MTSREKILGVVKNNQPSLVELIDIAPLAADSRMTDAAAGDLLAGRKQQADLFSQKLRAIGGHCMIVSGLPEISERLQRQFAGNKRIISTISSLDAVTEIYQPGDQVPDAANVDVAVFRAHFAVAENGAVWITEDQMIDRVLPFISQHLVVVISYDAIVDNMHDAYDKIGPAVYGYACFIAGPSKTADIEQSLVLGAHGPVSMTVFIVQADS